MFVFDVLAFALAGYATGCFFRYQVSALLPVAVATAVSIRLLTWRDEYRLESLRDPFRQFRAACVIAVVWLAVALCVELAAPPKNRVPATDFVVAVIVSLALFACARATLSMLLKALSRTGRLNQKIAILGLNDFSREVVHRLRADPVTASRIAGIYRLPGDAPSVTHGGLLVHGGLEEMIHHSQSSRFEIALLALPPTAGSSELIEAIKQPLAACMSDIAFVLEYDLAPWLAKRLEDVGNGLTLSVETYPLSGASVICKDVFDRVAAFVLLLLTSPIFVLILLAIRCDSEGPVLFRQVRYGFRNQTFHIIKFRTMYHHLEDQAATMQTSRGDHRVTPVGRWLRKTSLDELPQLINVLIGNMSLVGPRPHALGTNTGMRPLDEIAAQYPMRHRVKPGITGLAQISGCRGALHTEDQVLRRVAYDLHYIKQWSFVLDLKVLFLTPFKGFISHDAY